MMLEDFDAQAKGRLQFSAGSHSYQLQFERYYISPQIERIKVYGRQKELLLQSNRPYLKLNEKRKAVQWKIVSPITAGLYQHPLFINTLLINLERALDRIDLKKEL